MKIYSWNVNGIRAVIRKELFKPFIEKEQPDILCLQETKAQQGEAVIDLPGYRVILEPRFLPKLSQSVWLTGSRQK